MARFGRNEQLVIAGAAIAAVAYLLGVIASSLEVIRDSWPIGLSGGTIIVGSLVALAITFMGSGRAFAGLPAGSIVRIVAALVGAFALVGVGELMSDFSQSDVLTIVFWVLYIVGSAVLVYGAWAASGGNLVADLTAVRGVMRLSMIDRLVYLGAAGVVAGWFLLMVIADIYAFNTLGQVSVFAATLVLIARWLDRNPTAGRLPVATPWAVAGLALVAVVASAWWFLRIIGESLQGGDLTVYLPLLIYVVAVATLAVGGFLGIGGKLPQPAA
jgi:hypothetical protein